jgi:hypothetical protein
MKKTSVLSQCLTVQSAHTIYCISKKYVEVNDGLISLLGEGQTDGEDLQSTDTNFTGWDN